MNLAESFRVALRALSANKLRSALTMLGIVIGVAAVIALMAAGQGVQVFVTEQFQGIGSNLLFVLPNIGPRGHFGGMTSVRWLTMGDVRALADSLRLPDVARVAPQLERNGTVSAGGRHTSTTIQGVTPDFVVVRKWRPAIGEFVTPQDVEGRSRVAVLGKTVAETLFPDNPAPVGETVRINNIPFRVIGIMEEKGGTFTDQDDAVFV
ncbi:MAG: ABC transporter permease, partial [Anaerolineae bacterium]